MSELTQNQIIDLLHQHVEAGCDAVLADAPVNQYAVQPATDSQTEPQQALAAQAPPQQALEPQASSQASSQAASQAASQAPPSNPGSAPNSVARPVAPASEAVDVQDAVATANALAAKADTLDALREAMLGFEQCGLKKTALNTVFSDGQIAQNGAAKIMLIGEAPGQDEDREGRPFVGRSGQLLDTMLAAIGLNRAENLYITNVVAWRPPGNRTPTLDEIAVCLPFIQRHIELVAPDVLLLVGNIANKSLLDTQTGITKLRGQWQSYGAPHGEIDALPLLHPAYVLRRPESKANVWADLCALKQKIVNA